MTNSNNYCVIMGGGIGSRFGPSVAKASLNSFLISSALAVLYFNKPMIASVK